MQKGVDKQKKVWYTIVTVKEWRTKKMMCTDFWMTIYNPLDSLNADDYDDIMQAMADDATNDDDKQDA